MTSALDLLESHFYDAAIAACEQGLATNPNDIALTAVLASALRAKGEYERALPLLALVDEHERRDKVAPGRPGRQMDISCLYWLLGYRPRAVEIMRRTVEDTLSGRIKFGDAAGGVTQGLVLYYMGTSTVDSMVQDFALKYMKNRAGRSAIGLWPGPVARYYLGEIEFADVLVAATGQSDLLEAMDAVRDHLLKRRQLCGALFHDGVRKRAQGLEEQCLERMRQCYALENPLIELEWYLARGEVAGHPTLH